MSSIPPVSASSTGPAPHCTKENSTPSEPLFHEKIRALETHTAAYLQQIDELQSVLKIAEQDRLEQRLKIQSLNQIISHLREENRKVWNRLADETSTIISKI